MAAASSISLTHKMAASSSCRRGLLLWVHPLSGASAAPQLPNRHHWLSGVSSAVLVLKVSLKACQHIAIIALQSNGADQFLHTQVFLSLCISNMEGKPRNELLGCLSWVYNCPPPILLLISVSPSSSLRLRVIYGAVLDPESDLWRQLNCKVRMKICLQNRQWVIS